MPPLHTTPRFLVLITLLAGLGGFSLAGVVDASGHAPVIAARLVDRLPLDLGNRGAPAHDLLREFPAAQPMVSARRPLNSTPLGVTPQSLAAAGFLLGILGLGYAAIRRQLRSLRVLTGVLKGAVPREVFLRRQERFCAQEFRALGSEAFGLLDQVEDLRRAATQDVLTGALNRNGFQCRFRDEVRRIERTNEPFSLVYLDIDRFKQVNDEHGHAAGDAVLSQLGRRIAMTLRPGDMLGRWGGDEFLIGLPRTDLAGAVLLAERVRALVASQPFGCVPRVTVSLGVAQYLPVEALEDLCARADAALYGIKSAGRNQVRATRSPIADEGPRKAPLTLVTRPDAAALSLRRRPAARS